MFVNEKLRTELDFFRRTNGHYVVQAGQSTRNITTASDEILYMTMAGSLLMDYSEDGFFEDFTITDKSISGKSELLIDAYAFIETESSLVKQLHVFQFKNYESPDKAASPIELLNFATFVNNNFVHPEFLGDEVTNPVVQEINDKVSSFLDGKRGRRVVVYCHYINNAKGVTKGNKTQIDDVMGRFLNDRQLLGFSVQVNGVDDIIDLATTGKIRVDSETIEMVIDSPQGSYRLEDNSKSSGLGLPKKVIICMCNVNEFIRLQNRYHHNQLYTENIRLYLGDRGSVNKDIIHTITSNDSIWFPYMNNGISIICDKLTIGSYIPSRKTQPLTLENMQIINGCQTVNALYSAKYGYNTKDNFRATNVMVRIYEIDADQIDFKMSIIRATNNQNAVKSYSLMANDPIQISIAKILERFDIVYDRKGESKQEPDKGLPVISMTTAALAYRAVYEFKARSLRSGLGKSRVFMKGEYEKVFDSSLLEADAKRDLLKRCGKIIISTVILDSVRDLLPKYTNEYVKRVPIIRKSSYHLAGALYANENKHFDDLLEEMINVYEGGNDIRLKAMRFPSKIRQKVDSSFTQVLNEFESFYKSVRGVDKGDVDNLLKDADFDKSYLNWIDKLMEK